jgi:lysozyme family protein
MAPRLESEARVADLNKAILYVLRNEDRTMSGKVTTDRGGKTRFGIAQKFHPELDPSFYTCTNLAALGEAQQIYKTAYCAPLFIAGITSQPIGNKILDVGVNCGVGIAAEIAQTAAKNLGAVVTVDEKMGPDSVVAVNKVDQNKLMGQMIVLSQIHYRQVAIRDHASIDELADWLTRAGKPGI